MENFKIETDNDRTGLCAHCGHVIDTEAVFCSKCGVQLHRGVGALPEFDLSRPPQFSFLNQKTKEEIDFNAFVQENTDYYVSKFAGIDASGSNVTWNWVSFFVPPFWFFYRKMYFWGATSFVLNYITTYITGSGYFIRLCISVAFGIFGNSLYKNYVERHMKAAASLFEADKNSYYSKFGGVSMVSVFASIGIVVTLSFISVFLFN